MNPKNNYISDLIDICIVYSQEIDDTLSYYLLSEKAIEQDFCDKKNNLKINFKIIELFDSVYDLETESDRQNQIDAIMSEKICDRYILSDLLETVEYDEESDVIYYNFKKRNYGKYNPLLAREASRENDQMVLSAKTSMLSNAIVVFEEFLSSFYRLLIYENPALYFESKTVVIQELLRKDLNDILDEKVDEMVECDLFDSISLLKKIFEKENINIENVKKVLEVFEESYLRRNIYIHNQGEVNEKYLSKIKHSKQKIGDYLACSDEYFNGVVTSIKCLIFFSCFSIISKIKHDESNEEKLINYYFSELKKKNYELTKYVYKIMASNKEYELYTRMIYHVNYLISLKGLNDESFEKELDKFDVSASDIPFKIAKEALLLNHEKTYEMIEANFDTKTTPDELLNWPLYEDFRKTDYFKKIINNHSSDFESIKEIDEL